MWNLFGSGCGNWRGFEPFREAGLLLARIPAPPAPGGARISWGPRRVPAESVIRWPGTLHRCYESNRTRAGGSSVGFENSAFSETSGFPRFFLSGWLVLLSEAPRLEVPAPRVGSVNELPTRTLSRTDSRQGQVAKADVSWIGENALPTGFG